MKKLIVLAIMIQSVSAMALGFNSGNWETKLHTELPTMPCYVRDFVNGQNLAGINTVLVSLHQTDGLVSKERLNLALLNAWNPQSKGRYEAFGLTLGTPTGTLGDYIGTAVQAVAPNYYQSVAMLQNVANYISFDASVAYRFLGHDENTKPWLLGLGAKLKVPFKL